MAARKKCTKCGAGNDYEAATCSLCGQPLKKTTMEGFELEPRQWQQGGGQRRRGDDPNASGGRDPNASGRGQLTPPPPAAPSLDPAQPQSAEGHYLLPPVGPPLMLEPRVASFVFGRDETCSVRIASAKVSRRHAELQWRGNPPQLVLRDLNSQNGTFLNDQRMTEEVALANGDTIRMGDYIAVYRYLEPGDDLSALNQIGSETSVMETVVVYQETGTDNGALIGDATLLPIHEILRRLLETHATGVFAIDVSGMKGWMKIADGRAVEGSYAGLEGAHAVQAMSSLTKGRFRFDPDPERPTAATDSGNRADGTRRHDSRRRAPAAASTGSAREARGRAARTASGRAASPGAASGRRASPGFAVFSACSAPSTAPAITAWPLRGS